MTIKYSLGWKELQTRRKIKAKNSFLNLFNKKTPLIVVRNVQRKRATAALVSC